MGIHSPLAITLLLSTTMTAHALEIPSADSSLIKQHSVIQADLVRAMKDSFSPVAHGVQTLQKSKTSIRSSPVEVELMQDMAACLEALTMPCYTSMSVIFAAMEADNATTAISYFDEACTNCTDAATEFADLVTACNYTGDEALMYTNMAELIDASCADTTCAGNVLWSFADLEERRDTFCPNQECGLTIIEPFLADILVNATGTNCVTNIFGLYCLTDDTDATVYCLDTVTDLMDTSSVEDFCALSCPEDITLVFEALVSEECGIVGDMDECDNEDIPEFRLIDYCTVNAADDYCYELIEADDSDFSSCEVFDAVPAPGASEIEVPANCSTECATVLQTYVDDIGCCAGTTLEIGCVDTAVMTFISETCGVAYDTCVRPVIAVANNDDDTAASTLTTRVAFACIFVTAVSYLMI